MPFIQLSSPYAFSPFAAQQARADPFVDFLAAALAADATAAPSHCASKQSCQKPSQQSTSSSQAQSQQQQKQAAAERAAACQRACAARRAPRQVKRWITPNFDISEYKNEYILEGELPGVSDKSSISVDFEDAQTIVIRGEVKRAARHQPKEQEPEQQQELTEEALQAAAAASEKTAASEQGETVVYEEEKKQRPHSVTVEEVEDESETASNASFELLEGPVLTKADKGKEKAKEDVEMTEAATTAAPAEKPAQPTTNAAKKAEKPAGRYWISERPIGVFERKFRFNNLIDQDNVRASLENGLLTVVVPKRENYVRQVFIF